MRQSVISLSRSRTLKISGAATLPFLLIAMTACSSGSDVDSGVTGATTTGAGTSTTSTSTGQGGEGGSGGATTTSTSTSTSAGGGGTGGSATGGGGAGGATGSGGSGGGACTPVDEVCNGEDDDCDGVVDNGDPGGGAECSTGLKGICSVGHDTCTQGVISCKPDHGPGELPETCNGLDDDCNGFVDEGLTLKAFYKDADGDGFGTDSTIQACAQPPGYAEKGGDCNDNNPNIYPGATELCNDADDNCNGTADEGVQKPTFYKDNDGDGYGGFTSKLACTAPDGYVEEAGDCNDFDSAIYPSATEVCNDTDDDCDGKIDDGVATSTIYKDNDGDGFAPVGALTQQKCNVPIGWTLERDADGDGVADWDCVDSDVTVYPGAPTMCDGKDNDCDGITDRLCFTTCAGAWPVPPPPHTAGGVQSVGHADLDGNGKHEILFQSDSAFQIVSATGQVLRQESSGSLNFSRGEALVGDLDDYDQFTPSVQTLEVLTANQSKITHYKLASGTITVIPSNLDAYDASPLMARDMDGDGTLELFTTSWCVAGQGTRIFRYNRATSAVELVKDIADPDGKCEYTNGRALTDLDDDGVPELVFSNGYTYDVSYWAGKIYTRKFTDASTLVNDVYCVPGTCFSTDVDALFSGSIHSLFRIGDELRTFGLYFAEAKIDGPALCRYWTYDLTGQPDAQSPSTTNTQWLATTDLDADGTPESSSDVAYMGLYDVNGDGYPDRVVSTGKGLDVQLYNAQTKKFVSNPGSAKTLSSTNVRVGTMWDIDGSGRLAVLSSDESHNLYCHQLGSQTWLKDSSLPPHFPKHLRTFQWDNYEPNEGADLDKNNMPDPDQIIQIPSALTNKGDFYGYVSSVDDRDYYLIDAGWSAPVCLTSPDVASLSFEVYSFTDKGPVDGKPDGKVWEDTSSAKIKCFSPGSIQPKRQGEHKYVVGIRSQGTASPYWPYWLSAPK